MSGAQYAEVAIVRFATTSPWCFVVNLQKRSLPPDPRIPLSSSTQPNTLIFVLVGATRERDRKKNSRAVDDMADRTPAWRSRPTRNSRTAHRPRESRITPQCVKNFRRASRADSFLPPFVYSPEPCRNSISAELPTWARDRSAGMTRGACTGLGVKPLRLGEVICEFPGRADEARPATQTKFAKGAWRGGYGGLCALRRAPASAPERDRSAGMRAPGVRKTECRSTSFGRSVPGGAAEALRATQTKFAKGAWRGGYGGLRALRRALATATELDRSAGMRRRTCARPMSRVDLRPASGAAIKAQTVAARVVWAK